MSNLSSAHLILASTSKYRAALLAKLGMPFETCDPGIDESPLPGELPSDTALRLAIAKSRSVAQQVTKGYIIGSDQVASIDHQPMGKPGNRENAIKQLEASAGKCVSFHTAIAVTNAESGKTLHAIESTRVHFRPLRPEQIRRYLEIEQPFDCAGSFKCEGMGIVLFKEIEGRDPNSLIGLPLMALVDLLADFGIPVP